MIYLSFYDKYLGGECNTISCLETVSRYPNQQRSKHYLIHMTLLEMEKNTKTGGQHCDFLIDRPSLAALDTQFLNIVIKADAIVKDWKKSLFSYEWLDKSGQIKSINDLSPAERERREKVEEAVKNAKSLEKPVLGIGLMDNVEIGSGRATLLTLADMGYKTIPVHIPASNSDFFKKFMV